MSKGWIKLHRTLLDNPIWDCEPFTKGQAWVDLLLLANHKDGYILIDGLRIDIKKGQLGWSILNLSKRWKWSRGKTTRFLNMLKSDRQIDLKTNTKNTIITICNYSKYQDRNTTDSTTDSTTDGHHVVQQTDINNNGKKEKNEKEIDIGGDFDEFWKIYGRVGSKQKARQCWNKLKGVTYEEIIKGHDRYSSYCRAKKDWYSKQHCSTWINNQGWESDWQVESTARISEDRSHLIKPEGVYANV